MSKKVITAGLLAFVVVSIAALAARELRVPRGEPGTQSEVQLADSSGTPLPAATPPSPLPTETQTAPASPVPGPTPAASANTAVQAAPTPDPIPPTPAKNPTPNRVVVYYFHTTTRCPTCHKIEEYARQAVQSGFVDELKTGRLEFIAVNVDDSENQHFIRDYGLYSKAVVLSEIVDGKQTRFKNLTRIWELVRDQDEFSSYIAGEVRTFLAGG